jgi:mRNA interferase MazF
MVNKLYVPDRQDMVWVNFNPVLGHEQANLRPALVLSPKSYNKKTGLVIVCAITTKIKGYPFEVLIEDKKLSGVVLSDQVRTLDWTARQVAFISKAQQSVLNETIAKLATLVT